MPFQPAMQQAQKLNAAMEALAALGAAMAIRSGEAQADPAVAAGISGVLNAIDPALLDGISEGESEILRSFIRAFFRQALDLIENPSRPASWSFDDPLILQAQGQASKLIVRMIAGAAVQNAEMQASLSQSGTFLDIGTGVGWLAIEAAKTWPKFKVDGIDIFEPALNLAAKNLATSGMADRVTFRNQDVSRLDAADHYSAAFFAGPFIPEIVVRTALPAVFRAIKPGGWLFFGLYRAAPDLLAQALADLRVIRSGGHGWTSAEVRQLLESVGFHWVQDITADVPAMLVAVRKP